VAEKEKFPPRNVREPVKKAGAKTKHDCGTKTPPPPPQKKSNGGFPPPKAKPKKKKMSPPHGGGPKKKNPVEKKTEGGKRSRKESFLGGIKKFPKGGVLKTGKPGGTSKQNKQEKKAMPKTLFFGGFCLKG